MQQVITGWIRAPAALVRAGVQQLQDALAARLNRGLPAERRIQVRVGWPFWLLPLFLVNQILAPHIVWTVLIVALAGLYGTGLLWIRAQAAQITVRRRRLGAEAATVIPGASTALIVGDHLHEEFVLVNPGQLPVLWAEVVDHSTLPDYNAGRVVACGSQSETKWKTEAICKRRGVFTLGPHLIQIQDPFGLFAANVEATDRDVVVIYPRVVQLPAVQVPRAGNQGSDRRRRPLPGPLPAATITEYRPGDSLRYVHWASTARLGRLMVKDLEMEPSGDIWIVLDLDAAVQSGEGNEGTLEFGVVVAASLAAQLLGASEQRGVGLLAYSGAKDGTLIERAPGQGAAALWPILADLAQVTAGNVSLAALLESSRRQIGRQCSVLIVTPLPNPADTLETQSRASAEWLAQIAHLRAAGVGVRMVFTVAHDETGATAAGSHRAAGVLTDALAQLDVMGTVLQAGGPLTPLLTFRRRRTVLRSTPTGGIIRTEIEEEVG